MDWTKCIICQHISSEQLQCPANSKRTNVGAGYRSFIENVNSFDRLGVLPVSLKTDLFTEGIEQTLKDKKASWHKTCRDIFNNTKLKRAQKRKHEDSDQCTSPIKSRRLSISTSTQKSSTVFFFCCKEDVSSQLHAASTLEVDRKVRECALLLKDGNLLAKLSTGDMIAIEAKYHTKCLTMLYNKARQHKLSSQRNTRSEHRREEEFAFAELVAYIEESLDGDELVVFKLSDLVKLYSHYIQQFHAESKGRVNATRLKERILSAFPNLSAHTEGRYVLLAPNREIGEILRKAMDDSDSEACHLARAAKIIRRDIQQINNKFNGTFPSDCQENSIPASLKTLVNIVLRGPNVIGRQVERSSDQACLTISQLIVFNSVTRDRRQSESSSSSKHHIKAKECPIPIYTSLKIHGATRDKSLVDAFYQLGISVSYDRLLTITSDVANSVCLRYKREGVVCPAVLRKELFTTAAMDNIDHNPSSTTAHGPFMEQVFR